MKRVESICVYNVLQLLFVSCHGAPAVRDTCNLVAPEKHTRRQKKVPQTGLRLAANKKKTVVMTQLAWISAVYFLWEKIGSPIEVLEI